MIGKLDVAVHLLILIALIGNGLAIIMIARSLGNLAASIADLMGSLKPILAALRGGGAIPTLAIRIEGATIEPAGGADQPPGAKPN